jgi:hypothetical protein
MLIELDPALNKFTVFDELIKIAYTAYDINKCYVKPTSAYNEILQNTPIKTTSGNVVKKRNFFIDIIKSNKK